MALICRSDACQCGMKDCPTPDVCDDDATLYSPSDVQGLCIFVWCAVAVVAVLAALLY